ncbi:MAG: S-layer homology domain-containing protein [Patescibacteria group bacterium]
MRQLLSVLSIAVLIAMIVFFNVVTPVQADENAPPLSQADLDYVSENIHILYETGILEGYPEGNEFEGENMVTRFEAGVILSRFYSFLLNEINEHGIEVMDFVDIRFPLDEPMDMNDIPKNHWAYEEIKKVEHMGVVVGNPEGQYLGSEQANRYEFAVMLLRMVVLMDFGLWEAIPGYDAGFRYSHLAKPELIGEAPEEYWAQVDVRRFLGAREPQLTPDDIAKGGGPFTRNELAFILLRLSDKFTAELGEIDDFLAQKKK